MTVGVQYRHIDVALIRAAACPAESLPQLWSWPPGDATQQRWCRWLTEVWACEHVAEAVRVASPSLAERIDAVSGGRTVGAGDLRRLAMPLARYLARMRGRATPFGLFAGVATLRLGSQSASAAPGVQGTLVKADANWLAEVTGRLESCHALLGRLAVVANDLAEVRGDRLVVSWQPHSTSQAHPALSEVSVRHGTVVQAAVAAAQSPIVAADLAGKLSAEFPGDAPAAAMKMIAGLVRHGVLITSLRPWSAAPDGLAHVLSVLSAAKADDMPEVVELVTGMHAAAAELAAASRRPGQDATCARIAAGRRMRELAGRPGTPLLAVDLTLNGEIAVPDTVAVEAGHAAGALARLAAHPGGHPRWREYHARFLERYGIGAIVPVSLLTDPVAGLGFPAHYADPDSASVAVPLPRRDGRLLVLAQEAALNQACELVLDDGMIDQIGADVTGELRSAPHAELCADLRALSMQALADGRFTLAVSTVSRSAIAMTGRFVPALPGRERLRMTAAYQRLPTVVEGAVTAQLAFPPRQVRLENVTRVPAVLPAFISLAEHHPAHPDRILLADLAVTADNDGLYVVSLSHRQVIEPVVVNAAARAAMPPLARLLAEIPRACLAALTPFAWGAASCLPFLPRIRYRRSLLSAARWRIPRCALPGSGASWAAWSAASDQLRERLRLPAVIDAGAGDRRLRLNLDQPADRMLFRDLLDGADETVTVWEAPTPGEHGWIGGRAHEIVIPVASATPPARPPAIMTRPGPWTLASPQDSLLPGSPVLFAKLYGHPDCFGLILTAHLPGLLAEWHDPPLWWFVQYRDPAPHLRLRLHLTGSGQYGLAATRIGTWADRLRCDGLITDLTLAAYHPEMARYGAGPALAAAEALFGADSAAAVTQLAMQASARNIHPRALAAASMADLAAAMTGCTQAGMRWLISYRQSGTSPAAESDRKIVRQAVALSGPGGLVAFPGGPQVTAAWESRRHAAASYARWVADPGSGLRLDTVLESLLHMHHARIHGPSAGCERHCRRLARAIALARAARPEGRPR